MINTPVIQYILIEALFIIMGEKNNLQKRTTKNTYYCSH